MKKTLLLSFLVPVCLFAMTDDEKEKFWFKSPEMTLHHKRHRGNSAAAVMKRAKFKVASSRKAPIAKFYTGGKIVKAGKTEYEKLPISLKEEANIDRNAWIRFGLPLPEGGVFQTEHIRIVDSAGKEIPSQIAISGFWKDQSIKWALVQFAAPMKAGSQVQYFAEFGNRIKADRKSVV